MSVYFLVEPSWEYTRLEPDDVQPGFDLTTESKSWHGSVPLNLTNVSRDFSPPGWVLSKEANMSLVTWIRENFGMSMRARLGTNHITGRASVCIDLYDPEISEDTLFSIFWMISSSSTPDTLSVWQDISRMSLDGVPLP